MLDEDRSSWRAEYRLLYYAAVENALQRGKGGGLSTEDEDIQLVEMTVQEAPAAMDSGLIQDAKTIVGLLAMREELLAYQ